MNVLLTFVRAIDSLNPHVYNRFQPSLVCTCTYYRHTYTVCKTEGTVHVDIYLYQSMGAWEVKELFLSHLNAPMLVYVS